jgi:cysteinyl-tRNA synthetase
MIAFARRIEEGGYTYPLADGLYFDTSKVADYGALGALDLDAQKEGARVEAVAGKRQPWDFCVWRASPPGSKRLMEWASPWGKGAPGWHLECSVMSLKYLGAPFDIHTGGVDHKTVHHVNEIAQNQAWLRSASGGVNIWMHNEFLLLHDEKMSKSSGDFLRLQTLLDWGIHPLVYRFFNLQTHYRSQLAFSLDGLIAARTGLERILRRVQQLREKEPAAAEEIELAEQARFARGAPYSYVIDELTKDLGEAARGVLREVDVALSDDLATPRVIALLAELVAGGKIGGADKLRLCAVIDLVLGIGLGRLTPADLNLRPSTVTVAAEEIEELLASRKQARAAKDFARADEIRKQLAEKGVALEDEPGGVTSWSWIPRR